MNSNLIAELVQAKLTQNTLLRNKFRETGSWFWGYSRSEYIILREL